MRQIASKTGRSTGVVSEYLQKEREKQPDLDALRKLNMDLAKARIPVPDAIRTASILRDLEKAGLDVGSDSLVGIAKLAAKYGEKLDDAIEAGFRVKNLEESEHRKFEQIAAEAKELEGRIGELNEELGRHEARLKNTKDKLGDLTVYEKLRVDLDALGVSAAGLRRFVDFHRELDALGFTEGAARTLAKELGAHGSVPLEAAKVIARLLADHQSLGKTVSEFEIEKRKLEKDLERLRVELDGVQGEVKARTKQLEGITETMEGLKDTIRDQRGEVKTRQNELESLKEQVEKLKKEEARLVKELTEIDEKIAKVQPLAVLASLFSTGEPDYPRERVLEVGRSFLEAVRDYVESHQGEVLNAKAVGEYLGKVIGELNSHGKQQPR